jgi:hypothetical protein
MAADTQRDDERLAWLEPMRHDIEQARADARMVSADIDQVGARLEGILLRLASPANGRPPSGSGGPPVRAAD